MTWLHQCRLPGGFRIWLSRSRPGRFWQCSCGRNWELYRRRLPVPGSPAFWDWREQDSPTDDPHDEEPDKQGAQALVEHAYRDDARDDGERRLPDIRLGFQKE